ncbi:putative E3 ubiquitin-protein ligase [Wickerhamomyces ciferrii]|uniref:E3 ubiquitin-protein ligase n=1 Tax=Wickerhamomyces ciferrii (strain ATCC 14091 / BCRC 22168 / CBS 111 / JCM 3599 / NBRC 0793 / NRRL Y-1031 F-60-10) TaxID=1206466 RepID=K0KHK6_WICCF|nr:putative E3 ubiquitin-protein ligase [Wickerhamomyces ciferrii]CCH41657.1 putative E3 ubiquitin-protein ligase [Wickerhamomyces ciferrii]
MDEITSGLNNLKVTRTEVEKCYPGCSNSYADVYGDLVLDETDGFCERLTFNDLIKKQKVNFETCCAICHDELENDSKLIVLPCQHYYHFECIDEYRVFQRRVYSYDRSLKCPLCQLDLVKHYIFYTTKSLYPKTNKFYNSE